MSPERKTEFESAHALGAAQEIKVLEIEGIKHTFVPPGSRLQDFERLLAAPKRIIAHPSFTDTESFKKYIDMFKETGSVVFIDEGSTRFFTIFDCHAKDRPAWGDHSASYQVKLSREWERFKKFDGQKMGNQDFAEFIEDNVEYISAPITGVKLLEMAQNIKVQLKGSIEIDETLHSGLKTLSIKDDSVVKGASNGGNKLMSFPEKITLAIRIFHNHTTYNVDVYLRYRKTDNNLVFWVKIPDAKALEEAAFNEVIESVGSAVKLPMLKGAYEGPTHKK